MNVMQAIIPYTILHQTPALIKPRLEDKLGEKITTAKKSLLGKMTASDNPSLSWGCVCQLRRDGVSKVHGMCWPGKPGEDI